MNSSRHGGLKAWVWRRTFVLANPPFNVSGVDKERIKDDPRYLSRSRDSKKPSSEDAAWPV